MIRRLQGILQLISSQKVRFGQMLGGLLLMKMVTTLIPVLVGYGIDIISDLQNKTGVSSNLGLKSFLFRLAGALSLSEIFVLACVLALLSVSLLILVPWQQKIQTQVIQSAVYGVTVSWIDQVFKKDLRFFKDKNAARIANILGRGIHGHEKLINQLINVLLPVLIEFAVVSVILARVGGLVALVFIILSVILQTVLTLKIVEWRRPLICELNDIEDETAEQTQDLFSKGLIFQISKRTDAAVGKLSRVYGKYAEQCVKISSSGAHLSWLPFQFQTVGSIVALLLGLSLIQNHGHSLGEILILISFFNRFSSAASECVGSFRILDQFKLDVKEAEKILSYPDFFRLGQAIQKLTSIELSQGILNRDGLIFEIPAGLRFFTGDQVALVGPSGSGKSTLLEVFAGLDDLSRESLFWNGLQLSKIGSDDQLNFCTYSPQDPMVFQGSISENTFHKEDANNGLLEALEISHLQSHTRPEISARTVSGGEAKRIALVRGLGSNAGLCLLDEPTAGLNENLRQVAWDLIQVRTQNGILVTVTHDENHIHRFNKILRIENGRVTIEKWQEANQLSAS